MSALLNGLLSLIFFESIEEEEEVEVVGENVFKPYCLVLLAVDFL